MLTPEPIQPPYPDTPFTMTILILATVFLAAASVHLIYDVKQTWATSGKGEKTFSCFLLCVDGVLLGFLINTLLQVTT